MKLDKLDICGSIFVKAEWRGEGESLPPARAETLFERGFASKNRFNLTSKQQIELLRDQRAIDVNDPRTEEVLKKLQLMKNDYLDRLLSSDAKFLLHDMESFRHKLLIARKNDPRFSEVPIPALNSQLINENISEFYLDWLEDIYRIEGNKALIEKKYQV